MRLPPLLYKVHLAVTGYMAKSWFIENILIATVDTDEGERYDCIYCTIIRCMIIFTLFGGVIGGALVYYLLRVL